MKLLVVNADDFGADQSRNQGIWKGIEAGAITSVSVLANGPASHEAMEKLQKQGTQRVSVGLHFNVSEGRPLYGSLSLLVGDEGFFLGKKACLKLLLHEADEALTKEVALELKAQLDWALSWGIPITHIDGHHHVHIFPAVVDVLLEHARAAGIAWIRLPLEDRPLVRVKKYEDAEAVVFSSLARSVREKIRASGLRTPDFFCGLHWKGLISAGLLKRMIRRLPHGITELMVHPGKEGGQKKTGPFSSFSGPQRQRELEALLDPEFRGIIRKYEVILTRFTKEG